MPHLELSQEAGYGQGVVLEKQAGDANLSQLQTRMWLQLLSLQGDIFATLNAALLTEASLSLAKFDVLAQLSRCPQGLSLGRLSRNLRVSGGNVSGLVQRLEASGLITREMAPDDRRSYIVRLTLEGDAVFRQACKVHARHLGERLGACSAGELDAAVAMLRSVSAKVRHKTQNEA